VWEKGKFKMCSWAEACLAPEVIIRFWTRSSGSWHIMVISAYFKGYTFKEYILGLDVTSKATDCEYTVLSGVKTPTLI
jgi:hypothetical protein